MRAKNPIMALAVVLLLSAAAPALGQTKAPIVLDASGKVVGAQPVWPVTADGASAAPGAGFPVSGKTAAAGTFTAAGQSASFVPLAGRSFNVSLWGTFSAACQMERSLGGVWQPLTVSASGSVIQIYSWSAPTSESAVEGEAGISYRINCPTVTSGTVNYRVSQ